MATQPVDTPEGRDVDIIPGFTVRAREPTPEQIALMIKVTQGARRDMEAMGIQAIDTFFRIAERLLVKPAEDGARIDTALIEGTFKMADLAIALGLGDEEPKDDKPAPRVRRARKR
jgi:hypothetical protein